MSDTLKLSILSPERRLVKAIPVREVTLPGSEGQIQILPGHAALIGTLETGKFEFKAASAGGDEGVVTTGFFEVVGEHVTVLAETIELKGEIDVSRAQAAQKKAEDTLQGANLDESSFRKYQLKLQRALIRQQVGGG